MLKVLMLLCSLALACTGTKILNKATIYERVGYNGKQHDLFGYFEDLSSINFDNMICSAKLTGIWLFYEHPKYNSHEIGMSFFGYGDAYGINTFGEFNNQASSIRNSGIGSSYKDTSINIYERDGFGGDEEYFTKDTPYFRKDSFGDSIIVTGCTPWTLYSEKYFAGRSTCIYPADMEKCLPGFYPTLNDLGNYGRVIGSIRLGCHSNLKISGRYFPSNATGVYNPKTKQFRML